MIHKGSLPWFRKRHCEGWTSGSVVSHIPKGTVGFNLTSSLKLTPTFSLGYTFVGILCVGMMTSVAELSALVPLSGAIIRQAEYFVDPALSFAQGWNSLYSYFVSLPAELTAAAVIVSFWDTTTTAAAWIVLFGALHIIANLMFIRVYGEMEFGFATLKIMLIVGLNIMVRTRIRPSQAPIIRQSLTQSC